MEKNKIYILGIGGHGKVVIETAKLCEKTILGLYDDSAINQSSFFCGIKILGPIDFITNGNAVIAVGSNKLRQEIFNRVVGVEWSTIIHPKALFPVDLELGEGSVILAGAIIQFGTKIGRHCIINTGSIVDHDCIIDDFVHVSPNATLCGNVFIGKGTWVGAGAIIIQGVKVGKNAIIGAGSVIINDIPDNSTVVGNPGKIIKIVS